MLYGKDMGQYEMLVSAMVTYGSSVWRKNRAEKNANKTKQTSKTSMHIHCWSNEHLSNYNTYSVPKPAFHYIIYIKKQRKHLIPA